MSAEAGFSRPDGFGQDSYPQDVHRWSEFGCDQFPQPSLPYYGYVFTYHSQEP